jgi:hypothetical protein
METEENLEEQRDEIIPEDSGKSTDDTPEDATDNQLISPN